VLLDNSNFNTEGGNESIIVSLLEGAPPTRSLPAEISKVSDQRYYRITRTGTPNALDFVITLPYQEDDGVTDPANLTIAKADGASAWVDIGGTASGPVPGTIQSNEFDTFSDFVLANKTGGGNPLPVTWLSFTAIKAGANAQLEWRTTHEVNCSLYHAERSSDGINYQAIGTVTCNNTSGNKTYRYTDAAPGNGAFYYRIKQVDANGRFEYSAVQQVNFGSINSIAVYPNPARNQLQITGLRNKSEINLHDASGRVVLQIRSGQPTVQLQIGHLPAGMYQVCITSVTGERMVEKLQIMK
jgi:hypothetical protein